MGLKNGTGLIVAFAVIFALSFFGIIDKFTEIYVSYWGYAGGTALVVVLVLIIFYSIWN